jgi:hypothetical protein
VEKPEGKKVLLFEETTRRKEHFDLTSVNCIRSFNFDPFFLHLPIVAVLLSFFSAVSLSLSFFSNCPDRPQPPQTAAGRRGFATGHAGMLILV